MQQRLSGRVLLADDNPSVRRLTVRFLEAIGVEAEAVETGTAAVARVRENPGSYDAVLLDHHMPGLTGTEAAQAIRALEPDLPILMITGSSFAGEKERRDVLGTWSVLSKPFSMAQLRQALEAAGLRRAE